MKIKNIVTVLLVAFILASCVPGAKVVPTETAIPSITPIPSTPTITPTPAPENLADAKDLSKWVDDFVHAYGGKVTVNGAEMDASQLTEEIRKSSEAFTQVKEIKGVKYSFLVASGVPLAISTSNEQWRKVLGKDLAGALNMDFVMPILYSEISSDPKNVEILENVTKVTMTNELAMNVAYGIFTTQDWKNILNDWDNIKKGLDEGKVPNNLPYNWKQADVVFKFVEDHNLKIRIQHLLDGGDALPDSIYNGGFTKEELKKIIEFTTTTTVLRYRGKVDEWDVEDELVAGSNSDDKYGFWQKKVGLVDAVEIVAGIVDKLDPNASIIITEDHMLDKQFAREQPYLRDNLFKFISELQARGVPLDGVDIENNQWIHNPPDVEYMKQILEKIKSKNLYISSGETSVLMVDVYPWYETVQNVGTSPPEKIHADVARAYIETGARGIGFGDVADKWSFWNYSGLQDANPSLFDDNGKPKPAYYEVLKVLYEHLP
jgi:endo-1,4-beta-xylanase